MKKSILILAFFIANFSFGNITLPSFFSDHMVLQQNSKVKIWGWANPHEDIEVSTGWSTVKLNTKADNYAKWHVIVDTPKAGGPYTITIKGYNTIVLNDVLIGEVWLCSGQSNMEWTPSAGITDAENAIKNANYPNIRFFSVTKQSSKYPHEDLKGNWQICTPETMQYFSAVAYFFGKKLHKNLEVPIGLINSSWGGSYAETWLPKETFEANPELKEIQSNLNPVDWAPYEPAAIHNAMIAPLEGLKIAGVIWYQGENNTANPQHYKYLFSNLIQSWRTEFGYDLPFYYAQIAPFTYEGTSGVEVRDAQRRVLEVPNTGMVMTSDIGNINDIHPRNKKDVGLRFANIALKKHYKTIDGVVEGPLFNNVFFDENKAIISFNNSEGLYAKSKTSLFQIAEKDKVFHDAKFKIKGNKIEVYSKKVKHPKYVRFAWDNIAESNIFNSANLPASSFTTEY